MERLQVSRVIGSCQPRAEELQHVAGPCDYLC